MRLNKTRGGKPQGNIALERIQRLLQQAETEARAGNETQARRNVNLAVKISTRTKTRIPKDLKNRYCKKCFSFMVPGRTSKTRINSRHHRVETTCLSCGSKRWCRI